MFGHLKISKINMDKIKVAFLPDNIASMPALTVEALNKTGKVEARGFSVNRNKFWYFPANYKILKNNEIDKKRQPIRYLINTFVKAYWLLVYIRWADIVFWTWDFALPLGIDRFFIKLFRKALIIEWIGSDIRNPEWVKSWNPYYKRAWEEDYPFKEESVARSLKIQQRFADCGAYPAICPEISLFVNKQLFPKQYRLMQRINSSQFTPAFPDQLKKKPTIVHTPSSTGSKGTKYVVQAIEQLKGTYDFEYVEIKNMPREVALQAINEADIYIDQLILGAYGLATCEAMAMGKPVFCYLMPPVVEALPADCPIVNANCDDLAAQLVPYLTDGVLRYETGIKSRDYVEKYHDADKIAVQLTGVFDEILKAKKEN